jgi:ECF sigma factor
VEALSHALDRLHGLGQCKVDIVRLRTVWGMTVPEVAAAMEASPGSIDRDWRFAKARIADDSGIEQNQVRNALCRS